ncbi:MAG: hypothetical protein JKY65_12580 [Planctomycetes bacterium]|nr:hypothetical protein [Planctomycetota bacterium]
MVGNAKAPSALRLQFGPRGILPATAVWAAAVGVAASLGGLTIFEDPLGDALDRRLGPPQLARQAWVVEIDAEPSRREEQVHGLLERARQGEVGAVVVLRAELARFVASDTRPPLRVILGGLTKRGPEGGLTRETLAAKEAGPGLARAERAAVVFPRAGDGTWRRVESAYEVDGGSFPSVPALIFPEKTKDTVRLRALLSTRVTTLKASRLLTDDLGPEVPWRGGVWILSLPGPGQSTVWTPAREEVDPPTALALALEGLASGAVLREPNPALIALLVALLTVAASFSAFLRRTVLFLLAVNVLATAGLVIAFRALGFVSLPLLPLMACPVVGLAFGLARLDWVRQRGVENLSEDVRRQLSDNAARPRGAVEVLGMFRRILGVRAVAQRSREGAGRRLILATREDEEERVLLTQSLGQSEPDPEQYPFAGSGLVALPLGGPEDLLFVLTEAESTEELRAWWSENQSLVEGMVASARLRLETSPVSPSALDRLSHMTGEAISQLGSLCEVVRHVSEPMLMTDALGLPLLDNEAYRLQAAALGCEREDLLAVLVALTGQEEAALCARIAATLKSGEPALIEPTSGKWAPTLSRVTRAEGSFALLIHPREQGE